MLVPVVIGGVTRWKKPEEMASKEKPFRQPLLREAFGAVIRERRMDAGKTLRQVSADARMALGYLSEVERGQKEPSSEVLASLCDAMGMTMAQLLAGASARMQPPTRVPDTIPADMVKDVLTGSDH